MKIKIREHHFMNRLGVDTTYLVEVYFDNGIVEKKEFLTQMEVESFLKGIGGRNG